jgi:AcrR family transcriptional regulator
MPPEERRAALIAATLPLLLEHGLSVTTRQIADAAGVAEGTIFGVFPDKPSLIRATLLSQFDPQLAVRALQNVPATGDLRERLSAVAEILVRGFEASAPLLAMARSLPTDVTHDLFERFGQGRQHILDAIVAIIEPDSALLRQPPATAALLFLSLLFSATRNHFGGGEPLRSQEIVAVLLDGLLVRPPTPTDTGDSA